MSISVHSAAQNSRSPNALSLGEVLILILSLRSAIAVAFSGRGESAFCQRC